MPADVNPPYRVVCNDLVRAEIISISKRLHAQGFARQALAKALAHLNEALGNRPHEAGEGHFHIGELRWLVCYAFSPPFGVEYAIVEDEHVVIIRRVFATKQGK